jgi:hypothetical protein
MKNNTGISWRWPVTMVFARFILALVLQLLLALVYFSFKDQHPLQSAGRWFTVYGSLIDIGCLILINRQLRKEGIKIRDLLNFDRNRIGKTILTGFLYTLLFFPNLHDRYCRKHVPVLRNLRTHAGHGRYPALGSAFQCTCLSAPVGIH